MAALAQFRNNNQPPASPTSTVYSGISNYRNESYRPLRDTKGAPAVPPVDSLVIARTHFDELSLFLDSHMAKEPPGARASAREKLTRLTRQQFQELSTDVYDELVRRKNNTSKNEVPFLPVRDEFHPKRNQARQKLATLPKTRFKDLSSDVYVELGRRYPQMKEPETLTPNTPGSVYDDASPQPPPPPMPRESLPPQANGSRSSEDQYRSSQSNRQQSQDDRRPSQEQYDRGPPNRNYSGDQYRDRDDVNPGYKTTSPEPGPSTFRRPSSSSSYGNRRSDGGGMNGARSAGPGRKPSRDYGNGYGQDQPPPPPPMRKQSAAAELPYGPSSQSSSSQQGQATASVIIPNKSMIAEEEIKVPFGRGDDEDSVTSSRVGSPDGMRVSMRSTGNTDGPRSPDGRSPLERLGQPGQSFGLSALGASLAGAGRSDEDDGTGSDRRAPSEYFDKMSLGRASVQSDVGMKGSRTAHRQSVDDSEKLRRDYEFKIATMQSKMASLEGSLAGVNKARDEAVERSRELEEEVRSLRDSSAKLAADVNRLQVDLEDAQGDREAQARSSDLDRRELIRLRERVADLEADAGSRGGMDPEAEAEMRNEIQGLVDALTETNERNEELLADKEADMMLIQTLNAQVKDYKRRYEQAKTELRNTRATSQIFGGIQTTKDDIRKLPLSENGVIADIHATACQSAIDYLLTVARSDNPGNVISAMKDVLTAVTSVVEDVKMYEHQPTMLEISEDTVRHLRERVEATLGNLTSAARNHAQSFGLSPVSLMDAAASHVSAAIIDLVRLLHLRRANANDREREHQRRPSTNARETVRSPTDYASPPDSATNNSAHGYQASLRSIDEMRSHNRATSSGSGRIRGEELQRSTATVSNGASLGVLSPPASSQSLDDMTTVVGASDDSVTLAGGDNSWSELKPYLDAQSESLVYNIQNLLSAIRRGSVVSELEENLTQIITIVSSIVGVCRDSFPPGATERGAELLRELSEFCNQLSQMQNETEITKPIRTQMAAASFGVAKAMKELMKL